MSLTRANNYKLEIARKEKQKREELIERQKRKAMITKWRKIRKNLGYQVKVILKIMQIQTKSITNFTITFKIINYKL